MANNKMNKKTGSVIFWVVVGLINLSSTVVCLGNVGIGLKKIIDAKKEQTDSVKAIELMEEGKSNIDFMAGTGICLGLVTAFCFMEARRKSRE